MTPFLNAFNKAPAFPRSAFDALLGAAGTRVALGAMRRYPKTAIAMALIAGAGALFGGLRWNSEAHADAPTRPGKNKGKGKPRKAAAT